MGQKNTAEIHLIQFSILVASSMANEIQSTQQEERLGFPPFSAS